MTILDKAISLLGQYRIIPLGSLSKDLNSYSLEEIIKIRDEMVKEHNEIADKLSALTGELTFKIFNLEGV